MSDHDLLWVIAVGVALTAFFAYGAAMALERISRTIDTMCRHFTGIDGDELRQRQVEFETEAEFEDFDWEAQEEGQEEAERQAKRPEHRGSRPRTAGPTFMERLGWRLGKAWARVRRNRRRVR